MKRFLLSLVFFTTLLGVTQQALAAPCDVKNLVFRIKSYTTNGNTCTIVFDIGWDQFDNKGNEWSFVHLWLEGNYPNYNYNSAPTNQQLANAIGSIVINNDVVKSSYPNGTLSSPILTGTLSKTPILVSGKQGFRFLVENVTKTFTTCPSSLSIKGDVWASNANNGKNVHCVDANLTFLPPSNDLNVTGSLICGYKNGHPDNKINIGMTSTNSSSVPLSVSYDVYADNGDGSFNPATDLKVNSRTVSNISIHSAQPYKLDPVDYAPHSTDYSYIQRSVWISATATTSLGNTFTRLYQINNNCDATPPAPVVHNDYFSEQNHPLNSIKANVYGGHVRWTNELGASSEYKISSSTQPPAVNNGLDTEPTDAPLNQMVFELIPNSYTQTTSCNGQGNADFTFNPNGTFFIDRTNNNCINRVTFQYKVKNNITGKVSNTATVTVDFAANSVLPVTYKSFTATRSGNKVALTWETAMEENNRGFHVQRNMDGTWKDIAFVFTQAENGNSSEILKYSYNDINNSKGITQYRILQVDMDGKGRYSEIRAVKGEAQASKVMVYPNPSHTGSVNILFEDATSLRDVIVSDVTGRVVKQYRAVSSNSLVIENLVNGYYTVQIINHTTAATTVEKVIIKKR